MSSKSDDYTPQQYKKYNGQSVFKALSAIGTEASADELANFISQDIGESETIILPEIKQVLRRGILNGFLVRNGIYYSFIGDELVMQVDSAKRQRKRSSSRRAPKRAVQKYHEESEEEEVEEEEEENEGEQEEEMQADSSKGGRSPVKLYEIYNPAESDSEDEESDEYYEDKPPQKRVRLHEIYNQNC